MIVRVTLFLYNTLLMAVKDCSMDSKSVTGDKEGIFLHRNVFSQESKNKLHQQHIADRSPGNGQKHLPFPKVQYNHQSNGNQLRDTAASGG